MADKEESNWEYNPNDNDNHTALLPQSAKDGGELVSWSASEYMDHHRGAGWYLLLLITTAGISAGIYLLTKDYFATGVILILGIIVAAFVQHKPSEITYQIGNSGLKVGEKFYSFASFKSFSVIKDGALSSIRLSPLKRLMPPLSAYYAPPDEEKIIQALSEHLPYEEGKLDGVDRLSRRLRL